MKFSPLNVDFDGSSLDVLGLRKPAHKLRHQKRGTLVKVVILPLLASLSWKRLQRGMDMLPTVSCLSQQTLVTSFFIVSTIQHRRLWKTLNFQNTGFYWFLRSSAAARTPRMHCDEMPWDWQFANRNCYRLSRVSWALAQISCFQLQEGSYPCCMHDQNTTTWRMTWTIWAKTRWTKCFAVFAWRSWVTTDVWGASTIPPCRWKSVLVSTRPRSESSKVPLSAFPTNYKLSHGVVCSLLGAIGIHCAYYFTYIPIGLGLGFSVRVSLKLFLVFGQTMRRFPLACFWTYCVSCACVVEGCACQLYIKRIYDDDGLGVGLGFRVRVRCIPMAPSKLHSSRHMLYCVINYRGACWLELASGLVRIAGPVQRHWWLGVIFRPYGQKNTSRNGYLPSVN